MNLFSYVPKYYWKNPKYLISSRALISYSSNSTPEILSEKISSYLEICPSPTSLKKLHASVITHGLENNIYLGSKLINNLAKFNLLAESRWVFNKIINDNLSLWNSIVVGYFRADQYSEVLGIYSKLRWKRIGIHSSSITFALKSCVQLGDSKFGRNVHADAVIFGLSSDRFVGSSLIDFYMKCDLVEDAAKVFDEITYRDVVAYTSLITGYSKLGDHRAKEAFRVVGEMQLNGFEPNRVTLVSLLLCASRLRALNEGRSVHGYAVRRGVGGGDEVFETSLMDMYVKCADPELGAVLFNKMSRKTIGSWNVFMAGYLQSGQPLEALKVFAKMILESELDLIALANGLLSCADLGYLLIGKAMHCHIITRGVELDVVGTTALINMYSKCKNLSAATSVFNSAETKDAAMLNVMISGYLHDGCVDRAIEAFQGMITASVRPDTGTIISILSMLSDLGDLRTCRYIHGYVFRQGLETNVDIANQFINVYAKCGLIDRAKRVFDRIRIKDRVSWTSMMTGLVNHSLANAAMDLFLIMRRDISRLDAITYTCLVQALNQLGSLILVREVHGLVYRLSLERDVTLMNSLITTYSKQGKLKTARNLFMLMDESERHLSSWNTMIAAHGMHGDSAEALKLFYRMKRENVVPDGVTFKSILSTCSHTGLIEEGFDIFNSMEKDYGIIPTDEHYGCLVDLLCRAGKLEEAYKIIECAPSRWSASTLGSVLAACRVHGNSEMGERVGRWLLEIEGENTSAYCSLSNLYAGGGKWEDVAKIGDLAKEKGLKRTTGYSLVDSN